MAVNRRKFLKTGSIVAIAASLPIKVAANALEKTNKPTNAVATPPPPVSAIPGFSMESFAKHLNSKFIVSDSNAKRTVMKLTEIKNWKKDSNNTRGECFSLVFSTMNRNELRQNTYAFQHRTLGSFELLVVPAGKNGNTYHYEALFNRLH